MKKIFIYKDYDLIKEIMKIQNKCYYCNWNDEPRTREAYFMCKELIDNIEKSLNVIIKEKSE